MDNYKTMTDEELANRYEQGDDKAFDVLLERNQEQIYAYISFLLRGQGVVDDIFQDTFVRAIIAIREHRYHDKGTFTSWLMCIARNLVFTHVRDTRNRPTVSHEFVDDEGDLVGDLFNNASLSEPNVEARLLVEENETDVRALVAMLPEPQQEIIYMRYYRDMPFKEIARVLGISINTALGRARYGILNLRRMAAKCDLHVAV